MNSPRPVTDPKQQSPAERTKEPTPLRCCCGSLVARLLPEGIELKCRRCKRKIVVPLEVRASM